MQLKKSNKKNRTVKRRTVAKKKKNSRFLELAIVAIFALVAIYAASFAIRITHGLSKTIDAPDHIVRLQILNGCGTDGAANQVARTIPGLIELPLEVNVIDVDNFRAYDVSKTFVISRDEDLTAARLLTEQFSLDQDEIKYNPIENNYRSINATLVLGDDYETIFFPNQENKEN
jgi:hypothetical protein